MKEEEKGGWEGIRGRERERVRGGRMRIARSEQSEWVSEWEEVHSFLFRGGGGGGGGKRGNSTPPLRKWLCP